MHKPIARERVIPVQNDARGRVTGGRRVLQEDLYGTQSVEIGSSRSALCEVEHQSEDDDGNHRQHYVEEDLPHPGCAPHFPVA